MKTRDWDFMIATKEYEIIENHLTVTPLEYSNLVYQMINQDISDNIHILSMNYDFYASELKIKRQYFKL